MDILFVLACLAISIFMLTIVSWNRVRFEPTNDIVVQEALLALACTPNDVLFEPGCGDARLLTTAVLQTPGIRCIGIESNPAVFLLALLNVWRRMQRSAITIRFEDFTKTDYSNATRIYTFLSPGTMDELLPKFEKELSGARLVSYMHRFSNKTPAREIPVRGNRKGTVRTLYIYDF